MLEFACVLLALSALAPVAGYVILPGRDAFNPLVFIGVAVFGVSGLGLLTNPGPALYYLPEWALTYYTLITTMSLLSLYAGWHWYGQRHRLPLIPAAHSTGGYRPSYNVGRMVVAGLGYACISLVVYVTTYHRYNVTGYVRDLTFLAEPAAILLLQAVMLDGAVLIPAMIGIATATSQFVIHFFNYGGRGNFFAFCTLGMVPYLVRGRRPAKLPLLLAGAAVAITLGVLANTRTILGKHEATGRLPAVWLAAKQLINGHQKRYGPGKEFIVGAAEVYVVMTRQNWDYGGVIWNEMVLFLPRAYFPDKGSLYTSWGENKNAGYLQQIRHVAGVPVQLGVAPTGFANMFVEFSWLFPIPWLFIGYGLNFIYSLAVRRGSLDHQGYLVLAMLWCLYLAAQDINAAFEQFLFTLLPMYVAYRFCRDTSLDARPSPRPAPQLRA
ncbi:MAG: hypothetical protein ACP5QA_12465 [Phycisphaerae bacterium]